MSHYRSRPRNQYEPLHADADSIALRPRRKPHAKAPPVYRKALILLGLVAITLFGLAFWLEPELPSGQPGLSAPAQAPLSAPAAPGPALATAASPPARLTEQQKPRPLAECIKAGNLIDETVLACRYGNQPGGRDVNSGGKLFTSASQRPVASAPEQRLARTNEPEGRDRAQVRQWDGQGSYIAQWLYRSNRIDSGSVCANYRQGSIERRECRKGAKVYFKEQCTAWTQRWNHQRSEPVQAMRERFCSAAESFSPMH